MTSLLTTEHYQTPAFDLHGSKFARREHGLAEADKNVGAPVSTMSEIRAPSTVPAVGLCIRP
jgi:hypothetical protein